MASDSMRALAEAAARGHATAVKSNGPARPFLAGVGLDRPFFDDKNRAFWVLQSSGWTGFFFLRAISGLANSLGAMFIVHTLLLTATGYSLTLLMASLYRRLIVMRALWTVAISLGTVVIDLLPDAAPTHVAHFITRAREGAYDGTTFHRVVSMGIIQGGDPLSKDPAQAAKYGTGGLRVLRFEPMAKSTRAAPCQRCWFPVIATAVDRSSSSR